MEYCFGPGDGSASMWVGTPDTDVNSDGELDAIRLDFDGDGRLDDAIADLDGDGMADHAVLDLDDTGDAESYFTDDGSGTWAVAVDRPQSAGGLRWFGLDGAEHFSGPERSELVDFDSDGQVDDHLADTDGNGLADRVLAGDTGYVDTDGDGRWDIELSDNDGDGAADTVNDL